MNLETLDQFAKREEIIKLIKDDNERNKQLELLHKEKDTEYKTCWIKTTNRIKNSEQLLEKLSIGQDKLQNSVSELALIVKNKGTVYDKFIEESNNQKEQWKGAKKLLGLLKYGIACGGGAFILKLIENWPW